LVGQHGTSAGLMYVASSLVCCEQLVCCKAMHAKAQLLSVRGCD
jgi:hypothetical protein